MKYLNRIIFFITGSISLLPAQALAQTQVVCDSINQAGISTNCTQAGSNIFLNFITGRIVETLIYLAGAIAVVIIVIAGLMYVFSGGDPNNTKRAKDALLYAIIGLVLAILARVIVAFVISRIR